MNKKIAAFLIALILIFNAGKTVTFAESGSSTFEILKLVDNGNDSDKMVIVIMGDGYTKNELVKFKNDSLQIIDAVLNEDPFTKYKNDINFYIINVISNVSGASPNKDEIKDTYFGSCFNYANNIEFLLSPTKLDKANALLKNSKIDYDRGMIIVNSETYGGSGGDICTASANSHSSEILLHEFGHSFAGLKDEYFAGEVYLNEAANLTREKNSDSVKWKSFIGKNNIGVYQMEGTRGWYIPSLDCKMNRLYDAFCDVCKNEIEKKIIEAKKPKETKLPAKQEPLNKNTISVNINGKPVLFDQEPIIEEGRTLVPVRAIFEGLGLAVEWNDITKTVTGKKQGLEISLGIEKTEAFINGKSVELDVPAKIINGRTLVPVRFIAESTSSKVIWVEETRTVNINDL